MLGLGRSGTVRSASGMVRDGPGRSGVIRVDTVLGPGSVRDGPWRCRGGPGSSVLAPCSSVVLPCWVRVDDVFRPSVIFRSIFTPVHPGSRHLLVWGVSGLSGMIPCWVRLWCDLGLRNLYTKKDKKLSIF